MSGTSEGELESTVIEGEDLGGDQSYLPAPIPRTSLPVRFSDPNNPNSERIVAEVEPDELFVRTGTSVTETTNLIQNVSITLEEADRLVGRTQNILDQTIYENNMDGEDQGLPLLNVMSLGQQISDGTVGATTSNENNNQGTSQNITVDDSLGSEAISLEAALRLLPTSFNGENQEEMEIFLEKCKFALACTNRKVQTRLLQGITVRLTGKARQAIKFRTFNSWTALRDTLKAALEPQRTTTHLFLELYSTKQKQGEDVLTYSSRIEKLQNLIIEQETSGKTVEVAKALEASFKQQAVQVFIEGLGPLKDFIKARNPATLEKAIQASREEERVRRSAEESRKLYTLPKKVEGTKAKVCFHCGKPGHWAKDCRSLDKEPKENPTGSTKPSSTITPTIMLLVDSGADVNFIKLSSLKDEIMIKEQTEQNLSGITGHTLQSLGTAELTLRLGREERTTEFHVAPSSFPVPYDGILGKPFIIGLETILNYKTKQLILTDNQSQPNLVNSSELSKTFNPGGNPETKNPTENLQSKEFKITLQPRSETIISIPTPNLEEEGIYLIPAQTLDESILCSNTVNQVRQKQILIAAVNPTEQSVQLTKEQINGLKFENFTEVKVQTIQKSTETVGTKGRLVALRGLLNTEHLNTEERESLISTCEQYSDIFHLEGEPLTCTDAVFHEVNTPATTQPINERPYRLPHRHKEEINKQMKQLEEDNIIAPSRSPWNAPLLVVPKKADKDGVVKYRVCVDFRKLNQISVGDAYPLPNIIDILDQLGKSKYYTTLDLAQGYHQVRMHPEHTEKTAFSTDRGHFEFLRVPFGLKGAPATFQRLMNAVLAGLTGLKAFVYLDDIIIYALSIADHSEKLKAVFERLRTFNLKLQPSKCAFMRKEVNYLGHVITDQGVKPNPQKIKCVTEFPIPTNEKEVKSFLGLSGYYRRFVPGYGRIAKPLTALLKKDVIFKWTDLCQEAFDELKKILTTEPLLQYPDFTRTFNLTCDASNYAIGCVLSQGPIGTDPPIAYASRTLNRAELNYNTTEKELCAIIWGVKQFRPYLFGQKFNIVTDHRALNWLFNIKDPGSRLTRWRLKLAEYEYEIHFKPGASNTNADALSRINRVVTRSSKSPNSTESPDCTEPSTSTEHSSSTEPLSSYQKFLKEKISFTPNVVESKGDIFETDPSIPLAHCVSSDLKLTKGIALEFRRRFGGLNQLGRLPRSVPDVLSLRLKEREIFYLVTKQYFWQKPEPEHLFQSLQKLQTLCEEREINTLICPRLGTGLDGLQWDMVRSMLQYIFRSSQVTIQVLVPETLSEEEQIQIIREFHENPMGGHQGNTRTYQRISQHHSWKGMRKQIKKYIRECSTCQVNKSSNRTAREPMIITTTASRPFEKIYMDIVGPLTKSYNGNVFILTLQDDLSKFAWAVPMPNHEANTVAKFFVTQFVCLHGLPQSLVTDCGTEFLSKVFKEVCQLLKIKQTSTSPYHPQSNGSLERSHRTLAEYLRSFVKKDPQNWDTHVPFAMFCHNSTTHTSTKYQPYQLVYGHPITVPNSFMKNTEPQYNYNDYYFELKRNMQEAQAQAKTHLYDSKQKSKERYDQKISHLTISIGDKVLIQEKSSKGKLAPKWIGPYTVIETNQDSPNITILKKNRPVTLHKNLLKPFYERN
ncbi:hypothetical protein QTP88_023860 [Uroleucon formosanum]